MQEYAASRGLAVLRARMEGTRKKCRRGESLPSGGASVSGEVKEPPDLKDLRPKGQKMTGGLKSIRGKQESGSQKGFRFPAFLA